MQKIFTLIADNTATGWFLDDGDPGSGFHVMAAFTSEEAAKAWADYTVHKEADEHGTDFVELTWTRNEDDGILSADDGYGDGTIIMIVPTTLDPTV